MGLIIGLGLLLIILIAIIISSLPLYFAVLMLGGEASILKVFLTNLLIGILSGVLVNYFGFGSLIVLLFVVIFYSFMFKVGFIRSFLAFLIQYVIAFLLVILFAFVFGISLGLGILFL